MPATAPTAAEKKTAAAAPKVSPIDEAADLLARYVAYRRKQLRDQLGGTGQQRSGAAMIQARERESFLAELDAFGQWLADGAPSAENVLTRADRELYLAMRERGLPLPEGIEDQL